MEKAQAITYVIYEHTVTCVKGGLIKSTANAVKVRPSTLQG